MYAFVFQIEFIILHVFLILSLPAPQIFDFSLLAHLCTFIIATKGAKILRARTRSRGTFTAFKNCPRLV
jgi:hypothetical protein